MLRTAIALGAAALAAAAPLSPAAAAAFQNGSFEAGAFVDNDPVDQSDRLFVGSDSITGWTVIGGSDIAWERNGNPYGTVASDGDFLLDLTGYTDRAPFGGVRQTFDSVAGHRYSLSFDVGNLPGNSNTAVTAFVDGVSVLPFVNTQPSTGSTLWRTATGTFTAGGATTQLDLLGTATERDTILLDNVRVIDLDADADAAVPEPASWAAMVLGIGLVGAGLRRRSVAVRYA